MQADIKSTRVTAIENIGVARDRTLNGRHARVPAGTVLVSADNHWGLAEDIWRDRVPPHLRDRVPRIWFDEELKLWNMAIGERVVFGRPMAKIVKSIEDRIGSNAIAGRMAELDADGVAMEIAFPQWLQIYFSHPDYEAREWIFRIYNEYLAEVARRAPGRFFGVGVANYWDPEKTAESIRHIKDLGLKTFMIPIHPGKHPDGTPVLYADEKMAPLWAAAEEAGLPVCFHVGESIGNEGPGAIAIGGMINFTPFRKSFAELTFGGIFDRHPGLQVVFAEANINWIPGTLQDAEMFLDTYNELLRPKIKLRPTEYWKRHCSATFIVDQVGLKMMDYIGVENVMWSSDYPHNEGSFGYTAEIVDTIVETFSAEDAKKILGGNAIRIFDLP